MEYNQAWPNSAPQADVGRSASSQAPPQYQVIVSKSAIPQDTLRKATAKDLDKLKSELAMLYHEKKLPQIRALVMQNHNLDASEQQFKNRFQKWRWSKNINWAVVLRKVGERSRIGKESEVRIRKELISQAKIDRYTNDHSVIIAGSQNERKGKMSVLGKNEVAATPSDIIVCTPRSAAHPSPFAAQSPHFQMHSSIELPYMESPNRSSELDIMDVDEEVDLHTASSIRYFTPGYDEEEDLHRLRQDSSPSPDISPPPSPTSTISGIVSEPSRFRGHSPAPMFDYVYLPSFEPTNIFQRLYSDSLSQPMSSTGGSTKWQVEKNPIGFRYRQEEEDSLRGKMDLVTLESEDNNPEIEQISFVLIHLLRDQGRYKAAEELIRQVLNTYVAVDDQNVGKLHTLSLLANILDCQGYHQEAMRIYRRVVHSQERVLGPEHPDTLSSKHSMAWSFFLLGNYKQAEKLGKEVIDIKTRILGADHPNTLASINNLALAYKEQGLWGKAEELQVRLLASGRKAWGNEHPSTLRSMHNLAATLRCQGRRKEADTLGKEALEIRKRVLGEEHPHTLLSMSAQALIYADQGRWHDAEQLQEELLRLTQKVRGEEHPDTLTSMHNLAVAYQRQGRFEKGERLGEHTLKMCKRLLGDEHPNTIRSMDEMASMYRDQGRLEDAAMLGLEALRLLQNSSGRDHPTTLTIKSNLAVTYVAQRLFDDAVMLGEEVLEASERVIGKEHPDTITRMNNLAHALKGLDRVGEAVDLMEKCQKLASKIYGTEHPDTLSNMYSLAFWWKDLGRNDEAVELMARCLGLHTKALGADHEDDEAIDMMTTCVKLCIKTLGAKHESTMASNSWLAHWEGEARLSQGEGHDSSENDSDSAEASEAEQDSQDESADKEMEEM